MNDEYLIHYGVKGMKWGVRRQRRSSTQRSRRASAKNTNNTPKKQKQSSVQVKEAVSRGADFVKANRNTILKTSIRVLGTAAGLGAVAYGASAVIDILGGTTGTMPNAIREYELNPHQEMGPYWEPKSDRDEYIEWKRRNTKYTYTTR